MPLVRRSSTIIKNPFVYLEEDEVEGNLLRDEVVEDINIEDIILGCIRGFKADNPETDYQEFVNVGKVIKIYTSLDHIDTHSIRDYLRCGNRLARKYIQVLSLCGPFLERHLEAPKVSITGYSSGGLSPNKTVYKVTKSKLGDGL